MKTWLIGAALAAAWFLALSGVAAPLAVDYGRVNLDVTPTDAAVYVDRAYVGPVSDFSVAMLRLEVGRHHIEVRSPGATSLVCDVDVVLGQVVPCRGRLQRTVLGSAPAAAASSENAVSAAGGDIQITPIMHQSVQIEYAGKVIQVDPVETGDYSKAKQADLVLISDLRDDNLDPDKIAKIRKAGTPVVMPAAVATQVGTKIPAPTVMANGEIKTVAEISVEAVPMYNLRRGAKPGEVYHPKGRGNGYIITLGGKRLYFAGDTECTPEMKALKNIDVAFVPMNMPFTMTRAKRPTASRPSNRKSSTHITIRDN